jgi:hypothetical protein
MQEREKMNQAMIEQMQIITTQLVRLRTRDEIPNYASTSVIHNSLPNNPETNPRGEVKAVTSRDEKRSPELLLI